MIEIFAYDDYRKFLQDFFQYKKNEDAKYSLTYFSRLIDSSDSYLKQVISSRRSLKLERAKKLSNKLKFNTLEISYFLTLVMKQGAQTEELKEYFDNILFNFRELGNFNYGNSEKEKNVFKNSLVWELYTLTGSDNFKKDLDFLSRSLTNNLATTEGIKTSIDHLIKTKAIEVIDNEYVTKDIVLEHSQDLKEIYILALERAIEYLQSSSEKELEEYFDSFCIVTGEKEFIKIKQLLEETKNKMAIIVKKTKKKNRICFYNTNFFAVSKNIED